jgi:hypothetical protein
LNEIQYIGTQEITSRERSEKVNLWSLQLLILKDSEHLNFLHISEFLRLLRRQFPNIYGLENPNTLINPRGFFNPETVFDNIFVQVLHAQNHWIVVSNYNPREPDSNSWYVYDSLNNPEFFLYYVKPALYCFCGGQRRLEIKHVEVVPQNGYDDCGLFALAYSLILAMGKDPALFVFDQSKMRNEFNKMMTDVSLFLFSHTEKNLNLKIKSLFVNL